MRRLRKPTHDLDEHPERQAPFTHPLRRRARCHCAACWTPPPPTRGLKPRPPRAAGAFAFRCFSCAGCSRDCVAPGTMRGVPRLSVPLSHAFAPPRRMRQFTEVPYAIEYAVFGGLLARGLRSRVTAARRTLLRIRDRSSLLHRRRDASTAAPLCVAGRLSRNALQGACGQLSLRRPPRFDCLATQSKGRERTKDAGKTAGHAASRAVR